VTVERVTWTALPNHTSPEGVLRLSVFVSPRLANDDASLTQRKLGEYPTFAEWAKSLAGMTFDVVFDGLPEPFAGLEPTTTPDPKLWGRIFPKSTPVFPFVYQDHAWKNLHVFPVRPVLRFVEDVYGALAESASMSLPSIDDPGTPLRRVTGLGDLPTLVRDLPSFWSELQDKPKKSEQPKETSTQKGVVVVDPLSSADAQTFLQAYRFYYRPGSRRPEFAKDHVVAKPKPPELDFHRIIALLGDQPELLRRLGLIIDLELPPGSEIPAEGVVRATPAKPIVGGPPPPGTRYEHDGTFFGARPRESFRFHHGLLRLSKEFFDLYQVDVDGAAMKLVDFASTLGHLLDPERRSHATPSEAGAPALRTGGFAVSRTRRGDQLLDDLVLNRSKNDDLEQGLDVEFDLEDLVRGYRLDVLDEDAPDAPSWRSLHQRRCKYTVRGPTGAHPIEFEHEDEGYVKGVAASSERVDDPSPSPDLYLHEALFGWEGWSLAVPRPGKRIVEPGEGDGGGPIARHDPEEGSELPVVTTAELVSGTLPRLRFGRSYRLRARAVDLAGNSLPPSDDELGPPDEELTIGPQPYLRFEPLPSPTVLHRHLDTEGESLEHLVIRSTAEHTPGEYAAQPEVVKALKDAGADHSYAEDSQRHLAPPKTSELMAEQMECFEDAFGGTPAEATAALRVALREEGTFLDPLVVDIATGKKSIAQIGQTLHPTGSTLPTERGAGLDSGSYVYFTGDAVVLPYLPDPLAVGVAITGFDIYGNESFHETALFGGAWPELEPFRLRLSEGPTASVAFQAGVLQVQLPKAHVVRVRLSSVFPPSKLGRFAVWDWNPTKAVDLQSAAEEGRNWLLTPYRVLSCTHAVQRPITEPDSTKLVAVRELGDTSATFQGAVGLDGRSTGRVDVLAAWTEDVDLVTDNAPRMAALGTAVQKQAVAFGFDLEPDEDEAQATIRWHSQAGWRWCRKCEGLAFGDGDPGECGAGGFHDFSASGNYALSHNAPTPAGQTGWRWCNKCQALAYAGAGSGACPAGGVHGHLGSGDYDVAFDDEASPGQSGWRRCLKCKLLVFAAETPGTCASGGLHAYAGFSKYELRLVTSQPVDRVSKHEFGDTKYRKVSYHAVATTRFREFFPRTLTSEPAAIQTVEPTVEGDEPRQELVRHIPSSARPSTPDIVYAVPTFEWKRNESAGKREHVRLGNGVRVYLRRQWFSSGDGELLGVVVRNPQIRSRYLATKRAHAKRAAPAPVVRLQPLPAGAHPAVAHAEDVVLEPNEAHLFTTQFVDLPLLVGPAKDRLAQYVTDWGSDPVWQSPEPRRVPSITDFPRHVAHATGLTLEELRDDETVAVAGHEVFFEPIRKLWYCDIDVSAAPTYFPFVRLALARFQPHSLAGAHLSRVVTADFVQLVPDRTATVELGGGSAKVTVVGASGRNVVGEIAQSKFNVLEPSTPVPNTELWAGLQTHDPSIEGDLGWRAAGDPVRLEASKVDGFQVTWKGTLAVPSVEQTGTHRLLFTETETYLRTDWHEGDPNSATSPTDFVRSRIVYADTFDLGPPPAPDG
jgi:hypothetical protein